MSLLLEHQKCIMKLSKDQSNASKFRRWFNEQGKLFTEIDIQESKQQAIKINAEVKQCFTNCAKSILFDYNKKYRYIEGFMNFKGIPLEHAFLINKENKVVDITMGIDQRIRNQRAKEYGFDLNDKDHDFGSEYFGVEIPKKPLMKIARDKRVNYISSLTLYYKMLQGDLD